MRGGRDGAGALAAEGPGRGRPGENLEVEVPIGFKTLLLVLVPVADSGYIDIFGLDVTMRKQVEKKLLIHSQVFESATEGIVITDADRRIVDINKVFTTITGYTPDEVLGENISILQSGRHNDEFYRDLWASVNGRGSWQGEIWDRRKNGEIHPNWLSISAVTEAGGKVVRYIGLFSDISVMKQTQERVYRMAHYDSLTGLPNRRFFHDRLQGDIEQARRSRENLALMFVDLDGFKLINDNLGHRAGDQLLQEVADRIKECVRESDMVARMGGDEFTVILSQLKSSTTRSSWRERYCGGSSSRSCWRARSSSFPRASGSRSFPRTRMTSRAFCSAPTRRCTRQRSWERTATSSSPRK